MRRSAWLSVCVFVAATALAQDAGGFPTQVEGFRFGQRVRALAAPCRAAGGAWAGSECTLGAGTPEARIVSFPNTCRRGVVCRIAIGYYESLPAGDNAAWLAKFTSVRRELEARFGSQAVYASGERSCVAAVQNGDASCVFQGQGAGASFSIPAGDGRVILGLGYNSMRHSPRYEVRWESAAAVTADANYVAPRMPH